MTEAIQHLLSLSVKTDNPDQWTDVWENLNRVARELGSEFSSISVSSYLDDGEPVEDEEYYDEYTLFKVVAVMKRVGIGDAKAEELINELQNAGILFRERSPS
jgi:hypothetical protein